MIKKETIESLSAIRIVRISFVLIWTLFLYRLIRLSISLPELIREIHADKTPAFLIMFIGNNLSRIAMLWILVYLHLIIRSLSRGNAFHPCNPGRLRKVAIGLFMFGAIQFLEQSILDVAIWKRTSPLLDIFGSLLWWVFIGAVLFMIAEAFSKGIRLQQDQDLTV